MTRKSLLVAGIRTSLEMITPSSTASGCNAGVQRCGALCKEGEIAVTHLQRGPVLIVAAVLLLAACGGTASSSSAIHTPAATAAALVKGEFGGDADGSAGPAGMMLSTNGRQVIAYLCNGDAHSVSLLEWFKGPVTSSGIDITNAHAAHLVAAVSAQAITGTVTLKDGRSVSFTARLIPDPGSMYGLFRSEETFHGVRYLGGWGFVPPHFASARTGPASGVSLTSVMVPMPTCCLPDSREEGIIDEQTGALIVSPPVNGDSVTVPGLGVFRLTPCREAQC